VSSYFATNYRSGRGVAVPAGSHRIDHQKRRITGDPPRRAFTPGEMGSPSASLSVTASQIMQRAGDKYYTDEDQEEFEEYMHNPPYDNNKVGQNHTREAALRRKIKDMIQEDTTPLNVALDVVGLIPGLGEVADATNAYLYAKKGDYLMSSLSLISVIPEVGDAIGKSGKLAIWSKKLSQGNRAQKALGKGLKGAQRIAPHVAADVQKLKSLIIANKEIIKAIFEKAAENKDLKPYVPRIKNALNAFVGSGSKVAESLRRQIRHLVKEIKDDEDLLLSEPDDKNEDEESEEVEEISAAGGIAGYSLPLGQKPPNRKKKDKPSWTYAARAFGGASRVK